MGSLNELRVSTKATVRNLKCPLKITSLNAIWVSGLIGRMAIAVGVVFESHLAQLYKSIGYRKIQVSLAAERERVTSKQKSVRNCNYAFSKSCKFLKNLLTFTYLCGIMIIVQRGMKARVMSSFLYMKIRVVSKNPLIITKKER